VAGPLQGVDQTVAPEGIGIEYQNVRSLHRDTPLGLFVSAASRQARPPGMDRSRDRPTHCW
jgi:hypothetical protein